jgi:hypothetical protein
VVLWYEIGNRIFAIINDDQLLIRIVLRQKIADRLREKAPTICRGRDAGG